MFWGGQQPSRMGDPKEMIEINPSIKTQGINKLSYMWYVTFMIPQYVST